VADGSPVTPDYQALQPTAPVLPMLPPLVLSSSRTRKLPDTLSRLGIAGGAVYDALVALAAKEHGAALATRDARARGTYDAVGVEVIVVT
jgi:predicted nucleic acid-binding protein